MSAISGCPNAAFFTRGGASLVRFALSCFALSSFLWTRLALAGVGLTRFAHMHLALTRSALTQCPVVGLAGMVGLGWMAGLPTRAAAQGLEYVRENYTKHEFRIAMRDGARLFTAVYVPKDRSKTYPIMLNRTPYSCRPYGADQHRADLGPSPLFGKAGYIFAYQDVRGRWMSEGQFENVRPHRVVKGPKDIDEGTDTFDTIAWLIANVPGNNGRVGMSGISYPGFYTAAALVEPHPALKAASPQAPVADWFAGDDWHHNGAFILPHAFNFMSAFGRPRPEPTKKFVFNFDHGTPDGYDFFLRLGPLAEANSRHFQNQVEFWDQLMAHGSYDEFWQSRNIRQHLKGVKPAVLTVGGWFDAENLFGALEVFRAIERGNPQGGNRLVMGPWSHGQWSRGDATSLGYVNFHSKTGPYYREKIEFPFFEFHLKGVGTPDQPKAWVFETGTNQWRTFAQWPPREARPRALVFREQGGLEIGSMPLATGRTAAGEAFDEFVSDPAKPVPYLERTTPLMATEYMLDDQRFASRRPDVLTYQTAPLEEDITLAGPIQARLSVSTTGTDADWIVKLVDVYPDDYPDPDPNPTGVRMGGFQQLVRGEVMRGKFRNSLSRPEPFPPGEPTAVNFTIPDICHTFRVGHRVMVQVQSTWFPLVDRNPQQFLDIYKAQPRDFLRATHRLFRDPTRPSRLEVLTLDRW